jgi:hypothetical protein
VTDKPKRKAGRPKGSGAIVWNEKEKEQAGKLAGIGCNLNQIANIMGVSPKTLDRMIEKDPTISDAISKGRDSGIGQVMKTAYAMAVSGKIPAMTIFFLKTRARWAEARDLAPEESDENKNEFTLNYSVNK